MRDIGKVMEVFHELDVKSSDEVDIIAISAFVDALCKAGHVRQASQLLKRANNLAASAGSPMSALSVGVLEFVPMHGVHRGSISVALEVGERRRGDSSAAAGQPPPIAAHGAVMSEYSRRRDFDSASRALQRFVDSGGSPNARM